jgi:hypothetical protein
MKGRGITLGSAGKGGGFSASSLSARRKPYANLERFCMFLGYPRSGHSMIGALLDAHPEMAVAHELNVLRLLKENRSRGYVLGQILANSRDRADRGRKRSGYS